MKEKINKYIEESIYSWNLLKENDLSYIIKTKINEKEISIYKVGLDNEESGNWNFVFSVGFKNEKILVTLYLDEDTEREILESLIKENHTYKIDGWMTIFKIELETFEKLKIFLDQNVWCYNPGNIY